MQRISIVQLVGSMHKFEYRSVGAAICRPLNLLLGSLQREANSLPYIYHQKSVRIMINKMYDR